MTWAFTKRLRSAIIPVAPFMPVLVLENPVGPNNSGIAQPTPAKPNVIASIRVRAQQQPRYRRRVYLETNLGLAKAICSGDE